MLRFSNFQTLANNGLEKESTDRGFGAITGDINNDGMFKIPSLRNIELTGPYMHDGRFATLDEVLEFYSHGIQEHKNLDHALKDEFGNPLKLNFSEIEKQALIAFLGTLTEMSELKHSKFSDPWIR